MSDVRSLARPYALIALVAAVVLLARCVAAPSGDDGSAGRDAPPTTAATGDAPDDVIYVDIPPSLMTLDFDGAAAPPGQVAVFEDVTDAAGVDVRQHPSRATGIAIPRAALAALMGSEDPTKRQIDDWSRTNLSPFMVDIASLSLYGTGQAWGDVDRDGDPDLYLTDQRGPNVLLENLGDGTFERWDLGDAVALPDQVSGGAVFVDYDNDGWPDLHVLGRGDDALFHNEGGERFVDVTDRSGINDPGMGETATWGDYDGDGLLDAYVVDYGCQPCLDDLPVPPERRDQHHLFHNDGDGKFTDVTDLIESIPGTRALGFSATWFDYNGDGRQDLYVANDVRHDRADDEVATGLVRGDGTTPGNALIRNDGPGCGGWCFTDVTVESGTAVRANAMGLAVGDADGNGTLDLYFTNSGFDGGPAKLLSNRGDGTFVEVGVAVGAALGEWSWGTNFLDVDNDGRLDLYVAVGLSELAMQASVADQGGDPADGDVAALRAGLRSGSVRGLGTVAPPAWPVSPSTAPRTDNDRLLHQGPDGRFSEIVLGPTDRYSGATFGSAVADYDGDGWPDVVAGSIGAGYRLLRNTAQLGAGHGRLAVRLVGNGSTVSTDAVGSVVRVTTDDGRVLTRAVTIGGSLGSGDDTTLLFGLADASVDRVDVSWPDGSTTTYADVTEGELLRIRQGEDPPERRPLREPSAP